MCSEISPQLLQRIQNRTRRDDLTEMLGQYVSKMDDIGVSQTVQLMADNEVSKLELAQAYMTGKGARRRPDVAVRLLEQLAEKGYIEAQKTLGKAHHARIVPNPSPKNQFYWYAKAAESGDAESQYQLAVMYAKGDGVDLNLELSALWICKAAKQEHLDALYGLAWMYILGRGVDENVEKGVSLLYRAALHQHVDSQLTLGKMFYEGIHLTQDLKLAEHWLMMSSSNGSEDALCILGKMHHLGQGVTKDRSKAIDYLTKAVKLGSVEAALLMVDIAKHIKDDRAHH
ncbi:tetratricopeptide repeat protein [Vibrio sp. D431a]|uniref:tetratricopeptide repeat protein n=1 Tax=Vibrio sp. D431a TaxID=2837388 RepID=UPI0025552876|nr:tetratricopeptide repeat protein [Vibrio sp. D431a]MDK9789940.1 sel1 repeat family protein [Vibrio sp. D431a]